jgi:hypothetical protein
MGLHACDALVPGIAIACTSFQPFHVVGGGAETSVDLSWSVASEPPNERFDPVVSVRLMRNGERGEI